MAKFIPKLGQTVQTREGRHGVVRYIGPLHIAAGDWLGLELPDATGKNDGSVQKERYFTCSPNYGIFVRQESVVEVVKPVTTEPKQKTNGHTTATEAAARPRPGSGISPDVARKRQSLMSNGSASATGSRLSMRSPTKSPVKPSSISASSNTSTPRTGTPSTVARAAESTTRQRPSISARTSMGPPSGTSRPPMHASRSSIGGAGTLRTTGVTRTASATSRPAAPTSRLSHTTRPTSRQEKSTPKSSPVVERDRVRQNTSSPKVDTVEDEDEHTELPSIAETIAQPQKESKIVPPSDQQDAPQPVSIHTSRTVSGSRVGGAGNVESRTAQQREIEELKAKIRTLEKKRQEDRDLLKGVETLQTEKDRFGSIVQVLQTKLRATQQELGEVKINFQDAEARANAIPESSGEHESELELATLDKEMAEERAEAYQMELDALKSKYEELELEVEVLREENAELVSTMSPEEKATAGWLQMERDRERLREALIQLRDMSQENESSLKSENAELRLHLGEAEQKAQMYEETAEKLTHAEETNKHLMGQLEAVESNDEVVEAMEIQREQQSKAIEKLKGQIQDLEEHIQVADELELFHVDEEKRLHAQLDENEALLSENLRRNVEQDRVVEDLEYTLTKFRDVVQGLQSDIDELRRSRDISETQANEMSSKSRAMMDLNLRLQNNAAKTQTKLIDTELDRMSAELARKQVDILELFTPEMFEPEKKPVLSLVCFGRIKYKADLVAKILGERLRERSHLSSADEIFRGFETSECMEWISEACYRFERHMNSCGTEEFSAYNTALAEIEPVERTVQSWIDALKKDEYAHDEPEHLKRMKGILQDLSEKSIADSTETKATELITQMNMTEHYSQSIASQLSIIIKLVQSKLGTPKDEDEESLVFDKRMDQLIMKARTSKYLASKVVQHLNDMYSNSLCIGEPSWILFEEAERVAERLTRQVRIIGLAIAETLSRVDMEESATYSSLPEKIIDALESSQNDDDIGDDPFVYLTARFTSLQSLIDDLQSKSSDLNSTTEFEARSAPWVIRAREVKSTKFIHPETQEELSRLERRNTELGTRIAERERTIEEMNMRVEIAEKRFRESKDKEHKDKAIQEELSLLKAEKESNEQMISSLRNELAAALDKAETSQSELAVLRTPDNINTSSTPGTTTTGLIDESLLEQYTLETKILQTELQTLSSTIRYLRAENQTLRTPTSEILISTAKSSWLDPSILYPNSATPSPAQRISREATDVWAGLIDVAKTAKPIRLALASKQTNTSTPSVVKGSKWQSTAQTSRYQVLKQREDLEKWESWREDLVQRAKLVSPAIRSGNLNGKGARRKGVPIQNGSVFVDEAIKGGDENGKEVRVVEA